MRVHFLLLVVLSLLGVAAALPAGQSRIIGDPTADIMQTIQARKKLADDPDLQAVNIGVSVENRVATLWGPVPSAEIAFRAELCLRTMIEVAEVRNELFVTDLTEPIRKPLKIDVPPVLKPEHFPPALPAEPRILLGAPGVFMGQDTTQAKQPQSQPTSTSKKTPMPADASDGITDAVRKILQSNPRYRTLQFAVQDRHVYLRASEQDVDAMHEASRAIARLPNVEGVILLDKSNER